MKIVLSTAPRAQGEIEMAGLPFLGIGYVASYLEKFGHHVLIVDAHTPKFSEERTADTILSFNPEVVGFTATTHNRLRAIGTIRLLKKKNPKLVIVVGGPHFGLTAEDALKQAPEIDYVVRGEGEITSKELLEALPDKTRLKDVLGLTFRDQNGLIVSNPDRPFIKDLSSLPFPAWHLLDLSLYQKKIYGTDFRTIGVISARGCPNLCTFCAAAALCKSSLRLRNPKEFVDELEMLHKKYGFSGFNFWDDTVTISKSHILGICEEILRRKLVIKWYSPVRVNTVDEEVLTAMRKAGCVRLSFGIESGSPRILEVIKKRINLKQARQAVALSSRMGFIVSLNFIVNLPTETMDDLRMTADLIKELGRLKNVSPNYGFALVYPGTEMETFAKENGILAHDFSWNSPYVGAKSRLTGEDPSVPYMEWPGKELEKVKAFMVKNLVSRGDVFRKGWQKLKKVRSWSEAGALAKAALRFLKL